MPPHIPGSLLASVVFIYHGEHDARGWRRSGGTGFLVSVPDERYPDVGATYVVTNSHVIPRSGSVVLRLSQAFPAVGYEIVTVPVDEWVHHPDGDDVAAYQLVVSTELYDHTVIPLAWFMTRDDVAKEVFSAGDECFFIGRQLFLDGKDTNTPCARFGTIAMMSPEPMRQRDRDGYKQESIVIEARSLGGFSGSPVFAYRTAVMWDDEKKRGPDPKPNPIPNLGERLAVGGVLASPMAVLGIDWGHYNARSVIVSPDGEPTPSEQHDLFNAGMMLAVPAWKIADLLMSEGMRQMRDEKADEAQRAYEEAGEPVTDSLSSSTRDQDRVSLDGVDPEDALRALLKTPPHANPKGSE